MKSTKHTLFIVFAILTILSLLLSACGPIDNSHGNSNNAKDNDKNKDRVKENQNKTEVNDTDTGANKITICHKMGSAKHPYVEITVSSDAARNGHAKHGGDIIPAPKDGCPSTSSTTDKIKDNENETESERDNSANMIAICHKTGGAQNPYVEITVSANGAKNGHAKHPGDIIPAPKDGCPTTAAASSTATP